MNVLFITADQWRGDTLGAMAHPCVRTPHLDALASDGVLFARHYAQATPCAPGRTSLYTGLYLKNHRVVANNVPLDARHTNVALETRRAGYEPALFGYTDSSVDPRGRAPGDPSVRGEIKVLPGMTGIVPWADANLPWLADLRNKGYIVPPGKKGVYIAPAGHPGHEDRGPTFSPALFAAADSEAAFLSDQVMTYLSVRMDKPWFVHLSLLSPHPPFIVPQPYHDWYSPDEVPRPVRADTPALEAEQHPFARYGVYNQQGWGLFVGHHAKQNLELNDRDILQARATYYAMLSEVDTQVGRLVAFLKDNQLYDDTLIVFTSDHGEQLGDHWQFAKYSYYDATFHIPAIIRHPTPVCDASRGAQIDRVTEAVDVMPTILECLGLEVPVECDGESLKPFLEGDESASWRTEAHFELDFRYFGEGPATPILGLQPDQCTFAVLRGERYKYVHFTALPALLFDMQQDPGELENLADDPNHRDIMLEMTQRMLSWRMNHDERSLANTRLTPDGAIEFRAPRR